MTYRDYMIGSNISIHAPREGGDVVAFLPTEVLQHISIHAPREGGDGNAIAHQMYRMISIHAPREGGDNQQQLNQLQQMAFQSTPPARGATAKMHSFTCGSLTNK